jgi:hypothetical protein
MRLKSALVLKLKDAGFGGGITSWSAILDGCWPIDDATQTGTSDGVLAGCNVGQSTKCCLAAEVSKQVTNQQQAELAKLSVSVPCKFETNFRKERLTCHMPMLLLM